MQILGHALTLIGCLFMVSIGLIKDKRLMLSGQCVQFTLQAAGNFILGSMSGCVAGAVNVVRILVFNRFRRVPAWLKIAFIALQALLTALFGAQTLVQWLPVIAMVAYTWYLDTENAALFKVVNAAGVAMWLVHDIYYGIVFCAIFDVLTIISTTAGILMLLRERRKEKAAHDE